MNVVGFIESEGNHYRVIRSLLDYFKNDGYDIDLINTRQNYDEDFIKTLNCDIILLHSNLSKMKRIKKLHPNAIRLFIDDYLLRNHFIIHHDFVFNFPCSLYDNKRNRHFEELGLGLVQKKSCNYDDPILISHRPVWDALPNLDDNLRYHSNYIMNPKEWESYYKSCVEKIIKSGKKVIFCKRPWHDYKENDLHNNQIQYYLDVGCEITCGTNKLLDNCSGVISAGGTIVETCLIKNIPVYSFFSPTYSRYEQSVELEDFIKHPIYIDLDTRQKWYNMLTYQVYSISEYEDGIPYRNLKKFNIF